VKFVPSKEEDEDVVDYFGAQQGVRWPYDNMEVFRALDKSDFSSMPAKMTFILQ
jgi:hypothetical protein